MIINRLSVSGFKSMGTPIDLQFPEEGKIGIIGRNETGKSTLMEAISFSLYGLKRGKGPAGEQRENLVTWGKENARLKIEFTSGDHRYILERRIGVKSGHTATLTVMEDGGEVEKETNIGRIQERIEQITGMDRDSFTKLVYIRQKDLDALKELGKSKREQLVNKVMGMEVFDTATNAVKKDLQEPRRKKETKDKELELVKTEKERYEGNLKRKGKLEKDLKTLKTKQERLSKDLEKKNEQLLRYDWLSERKSTKELLKEKKKRLRKIERQEKELGKINERIKKQYKIMEEQEPDFENLEKTLKEYQGFEQQLKTQASELEKVRKQRSRELRSTQLPEEEFNLLVSDLPKKRQRTLWIFLGALIGGAASLFMGFFSDSLFYLVGAVLLLVFAFYLQRFRKLESIAVKARTVQSLTSEIERRTDSYSGVNSEYEAARRSRGYESLTKAETAKKKLTRALKKQTGYESIEALRTAINIDEKRSQTLELETAEIGAVRDELNQTEEQLNKIMDAQPEGVDRLRYSKQTHTRIKREREEAERKNSEAVEAITGSTRAIGEIERTLKDTLESYQRYPVLKEEVEKLDGRIRLLGRVVVELGETSKGLRDRVLPYAAYVINQILPDITDGRYSDLEILEDLQFKVHSMEAGEYKDRDVFSGGTQDQFLIALRLAFTQSILDSRVKGDSYSLLMDECTSSSDEVRKQAIFEVLEKVKKTFPQIFIIAHEDVSNLVDHHLVLTRDENGFTKIRSQSW